MENKRNIRQLIREKRTWTEPLSAADEELGFRGWSKAQLFAAFRCTWNQANDHQV